MANKTDRKPINRRSFLIKSGWVAAGITVTAALGYPVVRAALPALPTTSEPELEDAMTWVQVLPEGRIRFYCPRMEMGQGASLGLSQVIAEELNVSQSEIDCVLPNTAQTPPFKMTVGSESIATFFEPVSDAAARLRETLREMAATGAGVAPARVKDGRSGFVLPDGTRIGYGAIVPTEPVLLPTQAGTAPPRYTMERNGSFNAVGDHWRHHELEAIVTGQTVYSRDVVLPDMLYGDVLRPPAFGADLRSADGDAARTMPGVRDVVIDTDSSFAGVVADTPFVLPTALEAIEARWQVPETLGQEQIDARLDVERRRAGDDFEHTLKSHGDLAAGRDAARHRSAARYDTSFAAHAMMEPRAAVARVEEETAEVWCGTQDPFFVRQRVAKALGRASEDVVVHTHRMGGGFGGRILCRASEEAALLSAAVGRPVRVQWDREAEFQNSYLHPAFSHHIDAGVTDEGLISHWEHDFVSSPIVTGPVTGNAAWALDMVMADFGTSRGCMPPYRLANQRTRYSDIRTEVPAGAWRGLGAAPNAFAIESMMDELASAADIDPLEFRLQNLPAEGERLAGVLRRVAEISDWGRAPAPGTGRGLACAVYKDLTAVAVVMEAKVDHAAGELRVTRAWCAQDCGLIVNPDQVESLVMGNIVWGCSMALKERITIEAGRVTDRNFDGYEPLRHSESPDMTVALVAPPDAPPVGVGESALPPVAPAIANAVFAATGRRVRRLPMSYDSVFSDLEG